jgi:hypothetical protein
MKWKKLWKYIHKGVQNTFQITQKKLAQVEGTKQVIEANLALKTAKAQLESINVTPPSFVPN